MKINQLIFESKAKGGLPVEVDKITPDDISQSAGQRPQYKYYFYKNNKAVPINNQHGFYKLNRADRQKLLIMDPTSKNEPYPKTLYTTVLNINGKNANDGTAVFDLESFGWKIKDSINKNDMGKPVTGLAAEELWKQINPRLDNTGTDAKFSKKQAKMFGKDGKIAQFMQGKTGKYGRATRSDPKASSFEKLFVSGGLMAMDKMGLFGNPDATQQIQLDGNTKADIDEIVKIGQGQVLYQLLSDLQKVFDKTEKTFKSSPEYQARDKLANQDPSFQPESIQLKEEPLGGEEQDQLLHVAKELAYNDGSEFERYRDEYIKRANDLKTNDTAKFNTILAKPPSMPGEEPEYGDDGYDNPNDPKKSQAYKDAMSQGTEEIAQIFGNIDTYIKNAKVKVPQPDLLKNVVKKILGDGQLFPAFKYLAGEYQKFNQAGVNASKLTKKDYEAWIKEMETLKINDPEAYQKELDRIYGRSMTGVKYKVFNKKTGKDEQKTHDGGPLDVNGYTLITKDSSRPTYPPFNVWKADKRKDAPMPRDAANKFYNPDQDEKRVGDKRIALRPILDKYHKDKKSLNPTELNKLKAGYPEGPPLSPEEKKIKFTLDTDYNKAYKIAQKEDPTIPFPAREKWAAMKGYSLIYRDWAGKIRKGSIMPLQGSSHKFVDLQTGNPIKIPYGQNPILDASGLIDLSKPQNFNKFKSQLKPGAVVFHIGGKNSGKPGQPIRAKIKGPTSNDPNSLILTSAFNDMGYSTPINRMQLQVKPKAQPKNYVPRENPTNPKF